MKLKAVACSCVIWYRPKYWPWQVAKCCPTDDRIPQMWRGQSHLTVFLNFGTPISNFRIDEAVSLHYKLVYSTGCTCYASRRANNWVCFQLLTFSRLSTVYVLRITLIFVFPIPGLDSMFNRAAPLPHIKSASWPYFPRPFFKRTVCYITKGHWRTVDDAV